MMTKHTKVIGSIALLLLVVAVFVFGGLFYVLSVAKEKFAERQVEVAKAYKYELELSSLARLVEASTEERAQLASYMLHEEDVIDFLSLLERLANEQGVEIQIESLNVTDLNDTFEELQVNIRTGGPYGAVMHTLKLFETLPYQSHVGAVTVSKRTSTGSSWSAAFTLHVVKYKEKES